MNTSTPCSGKQGVAAVVAAATIQLTLGVAYIWSVFQTGVANSIFGGDNAKAGLTFSLLLAMLTIGSVIGGKLAAKLGIRVVVFIGGVILGLGFLLASFVTAQNAWLLWVTYGVMGGAGMGFTYSTTIACAQKWYPRKKGLITGIIVSALGFGGVVFTPIIEWLVKIFGGRGVGEPNTFMVLGAVFFTVCTLGCFFLKTPPDGYGALPATGDATAKKPARDFSTLEMLKSPKFYLIAGTFLFACMGGLMMIGFAKPIAEAKGFFPATATIGVLAISMSNSLGRLLWGMISDKIGRTNTILILLSGTAALSLLVNAAGGWLIFVLIAFIGFFYGGLLSTFPSLTADVFGAKNLATNYGVVLLGFGVGAVVASQIAGHYKNVAAQDINLMFPAFVIASVCAAAGIVMMLALKRITRAK